MTRLVVKMKNHRVKAQAIGECASQPRYDHATLTAVVDRIDQRIKTLKGLQQKHGGDA